MNEYDDIIKQDKTESLRSSMAVAGGTSPDQEAALQKLAARTGVPLEAVRLKRAEVEQADRLASFDYEQVIQDSPKLSAWLADPKNAAVAHDDLRNLSGIERTLTRGKDYGGALTGGLVGDGIGRTVSGVGELYGVAARSLERGLGMVLPDAAMNVLRAPVVPWYLDPEQIAKRPGGTLKQAGDAMKPPAERQNLGTDVAGGVGQMGAQIATFLLTGGTVTVATMMGQGADIMAEKTAGDIADPAMRDTAILAGGAITAITEKYGLEKILNRVPPEVRNRTLRFIADKVAAGGIEAGQEFAEGLLHDIARKTLTNKDAELLQGVEREMSAAALSAMIVRTALGVKGHARAAQQEDFVRSLTEQAGESSLRNRMPERFREYLDQVTAGGPVENVFIPADRFNTYFQEAGLDPAVEASRLGVQNFAEASLAGGDIVIPTPDFVSQLSGTDHLQGLWNDLRFQQGDMTLREAKDFEANRGDEAIDEETLLRMTGAVPQASGYNAVKEQIMGELVGRFDQATADSYATQYASVLTTLAERSGVDPMELAAQYQMSVTMPVPDALRDALDRVDIDLDPIIDRLRTGDVPNAAGAWGASLYEFVRDAGGLRDVGEVRSLDQSVSRKPGQKKLVRQDGLSLDAMLQKAVEAGYFTGQQVEELTESDLVDALFEDAGGTRRYSVLNENESAVQELRIIEGLGEYLRSIGADVSTMTNAEIKARMRTDAAQGVADVYDQAGIETIVSSEPITRSEDDQFMLDFATPKGAADTTIRAVIDGKEVGYLDLQVAEDGKTAVVREVRVNPANRRQGVATALYDAAAERGFVIQPGDNQTAEGAAFRAAYDERTLYQSAPATKSDAFKKWFGESKVVDAEGKPLVVYHGTRGEFTVFDYSKIGEQGRAEGAGFYFTSSKDVASGYGKPMEVYLSIQKPLAYDAKGFSQAVVEKIVKRVAELEAEAEGMDIGDGFLSNFGDTYSDGVARVVKSAAKLIAADETAIDQLSGIVGSGVNAAYVNQATRDVTGHDGVVANGFSNSGDADNKIFVAFFPGQIKSATGNNGNFDGSNPSILFQSQSLGDFEAGLAERYPEIKLDLFGAGDKLNLSRIVVPKDGRGAGVGTSIMREITAFADANGKTLTLSPSGDFGGSVGRLKDFYQRFGFVENKGKRRDFEISESMYREPRETTLEQNTGNKRGSITIGANKKMTISLFEKANLSTFLHETGHFYLEVMGDLASREGAAPGIVEDYAAILKWMGIESGADIEVKHHEMFARANEAYLMEGNSPSPELRGAFQRFKSWLIMIYKTVSALDVELSADLRAVFDRMYATDQQIEAAQNETNFEAMFATAADAGMSQVEFDAYLKSVGQSIETGREQLQTKLMQEMLRERTKQWKAMRETMRAEVAAEVDAEPVYQAFQALKTGLTEDGIPVKLSRDDLVRQYGKEFLKSLPRSTQRIYAAEGGVDADTAADMFGFDSGRSLLDALVNMKPRDALIEQITDDRMREKHGDIRFDGSIAEEAINALHNDKREDVLKIELRAIRKKAREVAPFVQAERAQSREALAAAKREREYERRWMDAERKLAVAEQRQEGEEKLAAYRAEIAENKAKAAQEKAAGEQFVEDALPQRELQGRTRAGNRYTYQAFDPEPMKRAAAGMIGQKQIRDLRPHGYLLAERAAAKAGAKAMASGDYMVAAEQKQRELFNHYLYKEAMRVQEEVERKSAWLADQGGHKRRQALGKAGADYLEQVDDILERYEFKRVPLNKIAKRESLAAWVDQQEALGNAVSVPEDVLNEARRVNWKQIPVDELRAVYDSVKNITHLAGLKNKLLIRGKQRDFADVREELLTAIYDAPLSSTGELALPNMSGATLRQRGAKAWRAYDAAHLKVEQLVAWLDNGNIDGAWARNFFDLADGAQTTEYDLHRVVTKAIDDLRKQMPSDWRASLFDKVGFDLPLVTGSSTAEFAKPTRYTLISIALNMGNDQNMQRLRDGNRFTDAQLQQVRDSLTDVDLKFVQGVWDAVEQLWPAMSALEKRASGLTPEKVEAAGFEVRGVQYRGGYFPLVYDSRISQIGERQVDTDRSVEAFVSGGFGRPTTNKGATKKRQAQVSQPLLLDMNEVVGGHIAKVVKDISHREAVTGLHNILVDGEIKQALIDRMGEAYYRELRDWTKVLVNDRSDSMNAAKGAAKFAMVARTNLAIMVMGWKFATAFSQFSGFGPAADLVGPGYLGRALLQSANSPRETWAMVAAKSGEMRNRVATIDRDVRDSMRRIADKKSIVADIQRTAFMFTAYADRMVSVPTWIGAYNRAIAEGRTEDAAVRAGDRAVRLSQGAGGAKDLAAVQRNNELMKLMTMFYTPFSALYARMRDVGHQQSVQGIGYLPKAVARLLALVVVPAVLGDILAGRGPGEDEDEVWWAIRKMLLYPTAALPGIRDFAGLIEQKMIALSGEGEMNFAPSYNISPIVSAIGLTYKRLVSKPIDIAAGNAELNAEVLGDAFESSGLVLGLPTAQARITGGYLYDMMTGEAHPENAPELMKGLLFRRKKEKR